MIELVSGNSTSQPRCTRITLTRGDTWEDPFRKMKCADCLTACQTRHHTRTFSITSTFSKKSIGGSRRRSGETSSLTRKLNSGLHGGLASNMDDSRLERRRGGGELHCTRLTSLCRCTAAKRAGGGEITSRVPAALSNRAGARCRASARPNRKQKLS